MMLTSGNNKPYDIAAIISSVSTDVHVHACIMHVHVLQVLSLFKHICQVKSHVSKHLGMYSVDTTGTDIMCAVPP